MAKSLVFEFNGERIEFEMRKVDRSKLYGFKTLEVLDENEQPCELATLSDDGKTLIGKGGTGIGYLTADGNWSDKTDLKPVNIEGEEIIPVPSSFAAPIELVQTVDIEVYLNHNIRLIYLLEPESVNQELHQQLMDGSIFKFPYSYRGGLEPDAGFLIMNEQNQVFFLIGDETSIEYVGLQQASTPVQDDTDESGGTDDLMNFGMI